MKWKTVIGIVLIIGSFLTLVFWETKGRDYLLSPVLVATRDIGSGGIIQPEDFIEARISPENLLAGSILPQEYGKLIGMTAKCDILENQQLVASYFQPLTSAMKNNLSLFVMPEAWIYSISSAARAGDTVLLYSVPTMELLGSFVVAFVKDDKENEVRDVEGKDVNLLDRADPNAEISHIEIICTLEEYLFISSKMVQTGFGNLLVVIKGVG